MKVQCHIQIVEGSKENRIVPIRKEEEIASVQICGLKLILQFSTGKTELGEIISFHWVVKM